LQNANKITEDVIGETFYNEDAKSKYFDWYVYPGNPSSETQTTKQLNDLFDINCLQGNRSSRFEQFCKERMFFIDSMYSIMSTKEQIGENIKQGVFTSEKGGTLNTNISVYSPSYIEIGGDGGSNPTIRYGDIDESASFSIPLNNNNKTTICGIDNVKEVPNIKSTGLAGDAFNF